MKKLLQLFFLCFSVMSQAQLVQLSPIHDAYVRDGAYANTNYGTATILDVKYQPASPGYSRTAYLKFDISSITGSVMSAKLKIFGTTTFLPQIISIYEVSDDSWSETTITDANKPAATTIISTITITANGLQEFDLSQYVRSKINGNKIVNVCIKEVNQYNNQLTFSSKESSIAPVLEVKTGTIIADFISTFSTQGNVLNFKDNSDALNTITSWEWSFPGGNPSTFSGKTPPSVSYDGPGHFRVSLKTSDGTLSASITKEINLYNQDPILYYTAPSTKWSDNLPIGNGDFGGMYYGGVAVDSILLNEKTCWTGYANDRDKTAGKTVLDAIRTKIYNGDYTGGNNDVNSKLLGPRFMGDGKFAYQPLGRLFVTLDGHTNSNVSNYRRELNITNAIASVNYDIDTVSYKREVFATHVDNVIAVKYTANKNTKLSMNFKLTRDGNFNTCVSDAAAKTVIMTEHAGYALNPTIGGVNLECMLKIANSGGVVSQLSSSELRLTEADSVIVYIAGATDRFSSDQHARNIAVLNNVAAKDYKTIKANHIAEYQGFYNRAKLNLDNSTTFITKTISERVAAVKAGGKDNALINTFFQYGRYMLISSSRPDNIFPANLQGIWVEKLNSAWNSDYHTNINIQMNYWPAEVTNLSDVQQPLISYCDSMLRRGKITAQKVYGCNGAVWGHVSDIWYLTSPTIGMGTTLWPMGAQWTATHLWEHYLFNKDKNWLATKGYPIMKEYTTFCADFLSKNPTTGKLVSGPSSSPENSFKYDGTNSSTICMGPAIDHEIMAQLFKDCIDATKILDIDHEYAAMLQNKLDSLAPLGIGSDGRLLEWDKEYVEIDLGHRHSSHLWAIYPGRGITQAQTPTLYNAALKSYDYRIANGMGGIEWSTAYIVNYAARFKKAEQALTNIYKYIGTHTLNNLWGNYTELFQIDGNMGTTAGIAEMLIQSHQGFVELLPALPKDWSTGSFKGLCTRGAFEIDANWENDSLQSVKILSKQGDTLHLVWKGRSIIIPTIAGSSYSIRFENSQFVYDVSSNVVGHSINQNLQLRLTPNPAKKEVFISYPNLNNIDMNLNIVDMTGKIVLAKKLLARNYSNYKIDTSKLHQGVYFVKVQSENNTLTQKLLIK